MLDLTTISLMLVGLRKATMGGLGMASLQHLEEWRKEGTSGWWRIWWNVTVNRWWREGHDLRFSFGIVEIASFWSGDIFSLWICFWMTLAGYPLLLWCSFSWSILMAIDFSPILCSITPVSLPSVQFPFFPPKSDSLGTSGIPLHGSWMSHLPGLCSFECTVVPTAVHLS